MQNKIDLKEIERVNADRTIDLDRYQEDGFENRFDYLNWLAEDYSVDLDIVLQLADVLGPEEDFDGLFVAVEDMLV